MAVILQLLFGFFAAVFITRGGILGKQDMSNIGWVLFVCSQVWGAAGLVIRAMADKRAKPSVEDPT